MSYFATEREGDEICTLGQLARDVEFELFARYMEQGFEELDIDLECSRLATAFGRSATWVERAILAYHRLRDLPRLRALQEETRRLDVTRLVAIGEAVDMLYKLPQEEILAEFDEYLVEMFTPKRDAAPLPTPMSIRRRLNQRIRKIDASLAPDRKKTKKRKEEKDRPFGTCDAAFYGLDDAEAGFSITGDAATVGLMERYVDQVAREGKLTQSEAAKAILTGQLCTNTKLVLHLYAAKEDRSSYFIPGFGWTDADGTATVEGLLEKFPARTVDLDAAAASSTSAYAPTDAMKAYVQARDGTCVYPGCDRPATKCQLDHRIPFGEGGPTTPANLFCLCQRHHNMKTDRRAFYVPDPATGEIVWLFADGTYALTQPQGLFAEATEPADRRRWRQTIAQRRKRRAEVAEFHARCHAAVQKFEEGKNYYECIAELERLEKTTGMKFAYWPSEPMYVAMSEGEYQYYLKEMYEAVDAAVEEEPVPF